MKILHVLDHSLPLHSGYAFRSQSIFRSQRRRGWQPVIVTSPKHEASLNAPCRAVEEIDACRHYRTGPVGLAPVPLVSEGRLMRTLARRVDEVVTLEDPVLLHAHSPVLTALPTLRVARHRRVPMVYEIRAFWEDAAVDHGSYARTSWKYRLARALETWVCRRASHVVVICEGLREELVRRGISSDRVAVVPNGVQPEQFERAEPDREYAQAWGLDGKKVVGFVGSFYRYEGLDLLVEAFGRLARARSDVVLLLVGGGPVEGELAEQVSRLSLRDRVVFAGRVPHVRVPGVYALIDVLAYPRPASRLTELVTPLKPLEAMAMGKALVASDVGGHRELIQDGHTGVLFPAGDASALTGALARVLADDAFRLGLEHREAAWVRMERSWEKTTAAYADVYAWVLAGNRAERPGRVVEPRVTVADLPDGGIDRR